MANYAHELIPNRLLNVTPSSTRCCQVLTIDMLVGQKLGFQLYPMILRMMGRLFISLLIAKLNRLSTRSITLISYRPTVLNCPRNAQSKKFLELPYYVITNIRCHQEQLCSIQEQCNEMDLNGKQF